MVKLLLKLLGDEWKFIVFVWFPMFCMMLYIIYKILCFLERLLLSC